MLYFLRASPRLWTDGPGFINVDKSSLQLLLSMASDGCHLLIDSFIHDVLHGGPRRTSQTTTCVEARCFPYLSSFVSAPPVRTHRVLRMSNPGTFARALQLNAN